jgi:hypothetical protein
VDNNAALQFTVCALGGAIVREERGRLDKIRDHQFRKLLESRRDKAVNEELQNLYEIVLVAAESEFDITGLVVADLQIKLSLNRILKPITTSGGNLTFFKDTRRVLHLQGGPSPNLQRGYPVDILAQILHGNAE